MSKEAMSISSSSSSLHRSSASSDDSSLVTRIIFLIFQAQLLFRLFCTYCQLHIFLFLRFLFHNFFSIFPKIQGFNNLSFLIFKPLPSQFFFWYFPSQDPTQALFSQACWLEFQSAVYLYGLSYFNTNIWLFLFGPKSW